MSKFVATVSDDESWSIEVGTLNGRGIRHLEKTLAMLRGLEGKTRAPAAKPAAPAKAGGASDEEKDLVARAVNALSGKEDGVASRDLAKVLGLGHPTKLRFLSMAVKKLGVQGFSQRMTKDGTHWYWAEPTAA